MGPRLALLHRELVNLEHPGAAGIRVHADVGLRHVTRNDLDSASPPPILDLLGPRTGRDDDWRPHDDDFNRLTVHVRVVDQESPARLDELMESVGV